MRAGLRTIAVGALLAVAFLANARPTGAASPGRNGTIAFDRSSNGAETEPFVSIWSTTASGTRLRQLTPAGRLNGAPAFSPNGKLVVYVHYVCRDRPGCLAWGDLWTMSPNGGDRHQLTRTRRISEDEPAFSPDGKQIAFSASGGGERGIWVMNSAGGGRIRLAKRGYDPAWSPDGTQIAFAAYGNIFVVPATGGTATNLTRNPDYLDDAGPSWSPDGSQVVFGRSGGIWIMNADGSDPHRMTKMPRLDSASPAWSPDGRWIVYSGGGTSSLTRRLYLIRPDGSDAHPLTHEPSGSGIVDSVPAWQPLR